MSKKFTPPTFIHSLKKRENRSGDIRFLIDDATSRGFIDNSP